MLNDEIVYGENKIYQKERRIDAEKNTVREFQMKGIMTCHEGGEDPETCYPSEQEKPSDYFIQICVFRGFYFRWAEHLLTQIVAFHEPAYLKDLFILETRQ